MHKFLIYLNKFSPVNILICLKFVNEICLIDSAVRFFLLKLLNAKFIDTIDEKKNDF